MNYKLLLASTSPRRSSILNMAGIDFVTYKPSVDEGELTTKLAKYYRQACVSAWARVLSSELAAQKALAAAYMTKEAFIIAADTVVACRGRILGKPADRATAQAMLELLTGAELSAESEALLPPAIYEDKMLETAFPGQKHLVFTGVTVLIHAQLFNELKAQLSAETLTNFKQVNCNYPELNAYYQLGFAEKSSVYMHNIDANFTELVAAYLNSPSPLDKAGAYAIQESIACLISGIVGDVYNIMGLPIHSLMQKLGTILPKKVTSGTKASGQAVNQQTTAPQAAAEPTAQTRKAASHSATATTAETAAKPNTSYRSLADNLSDSDLHKSPLDDFMASPKDAFRPTADSQAAPHAPSNIKSREETHAQLPKMPDFLKIYAKDKLDEQRRQRHNNK